MAILVTGGNGYIGSHCVISLLDRGEGVISFDNRSSSDFMVERLSSKIESDNSPVFFTGDLLNSDDLKNCFSSNDIEAVVHFAASSQVAESMKDPSKYWRNNVIGTANLLNQMVEYDVKMIVFSSTAATYGNPITIPIDEDHPQKPINPYGKTKLAIENMMDDYSTAYGLRSIRLRYFNVVGADPKLRTGESHDPETHLIPNIIKAVLDGRTFSVYGNDYDTEDGTCIRDYINVSDLIDAHLLALDYLRKGGKTDYFNLGTGGGNSVMDIISVCEKVIGKKVEYQIKDRRPGDPDILIADSSKAKKILGWCPSRNLEDSIYTAYQWESTRRI